MIAVIATSDLTMIAVIATSDLTMIAIIATSDLTMIAIIATGRKTGIAVELRNFDSSLYYIQEVPKTYRRFYSTCC